MTLRITKIYRRATSDLEIWWQEETERGTIELHGIRSTEQARTQLYAALGALRRVVFSLLDLPEWWEDGTRVVKVTIDYDSSGPVDLATLASEAAGKPKETRAVVIVIERDVRGHDPVKIPTPKFTPTKEAAKALDILCREADHFINGERSQLSLFQAEGKHDGSGGIARSSREAVPRVASGRRSPPGR